MKRALLLSVVFIILSVAGCAKRGTISGGLKDTIPPTLRSAVPANGSVNFTGRTIKLTFDEYVKLKDINKQLIVSPPMKNAPEITPSIASKTITIRINDTLQPNTTYSFNFGQSIQDNNEANPYKQFKYLFSTGAYIDSLSLRGTIKDAHEKIADSFVSVMLYDYNEKLSDSAVFKEIPRYITNTLDSSKTFQLDNLKAGKYLLVALKDLNNNFKFDPKSEKIGFRKEIVSVPNDTLYELELFRETLPFKTVKPTQASGNRLLLGYSGNAKDAIISMQRHGEDVHPIITKFPDKDSLQIWFSSLKMEKGQADSLRVAITRGKYSEAYMVRIKNEKSDSLKFTPNYNGELPLREMFKLTSSTPLEKYDASKMHLINKDSAAVAFTTEYDEMKQQLAFKFNKDPLQKYKLSVMPGAITDYMAQANDTLRYSFETKNTSDFGNLRLTLENVRKFPVIVELTNDKGIVQYSAYTESATKVNFDLIKPALYTLRVIYDDNKNQEWDAGNFLDRRQSEEVIYFPKDIDVRANWDVEQSFNLKP